MKLQTLLTLREGERRIVSNQLEKFSANLSPREYRKLLTIVTEKAASIRSLNDKIRIHNELEDVITEMEESDEYSITLDLKIETLTEAMETNINRQNTDSQQADENVNNSVIDPNQSTSNQVEFSTSTETRQEVSNVTQNLPTTSTSSVYSKLPKLSLPSFNGDLCNWQTFWDCYDSSVHNNPSLTDVQRFTYLKSLLQDSAAKSVAGFPLTNANYSKAIDMLQRRYGKPHKIRATYMQSLTKLAKPDDTLSSLQNFYDDLETIIRGLESLGQREELYGDMLIPIIMEKLPRTVKKNIARGYGNNELTLQQLRCAIENEVSIHEAGETMEDCEYHIPTASFFTGTRCKERPTKRRKISHTNKPENEPKKSCLFCYGTHNPTDCRKVTDTKARIDIVKRKNACFNCLRNHRVSACPSRYTCRNCHKKHHTSICENTTNRSNLNPEAEPYPNQSETVALHSTTLQRSNVLLKTAIAKVNAGNITTDAHILFDEGAQRSFVTTKLANELQLTRTGTETVNLAAFGESNQRACHMETATLHIITRVGEKIPVDVLIVPTIAVPLRNYQRDVRSLNYLKGLQLAHPVTMEMSFEISLLVGADTYWKIVQNRVIRGNGPTAVKSKLGYLLSGPLPVNEKTDKPTTHYMLNVITSPPNVMDLERFWKLESLGISENECDNPTSGTRLDTYIENSISFTEGHYTAKLPWKSDHNELPTNHDIAKRRTENMISRLHKEPHLLTKYGDIINDQLKRGFIEKVYEDQIPEHKVHYIPHHGVKKDSISTPIRIVYDCSCRQSRDSLSLNDCLESTPPELNDITEILIRFRLHRYAVSTDIEKAFLMVKLDKQDRDVTRFFWPRDVHDPNSPLDTYRFQSVLFGATCSPFILSATLLKHLQLNSEQWVSEQLKRDLYVDNILSSFDEEDTVLKYFTDTRALMSVASFNLRAWSSNSNQLCDLANQENVLDEDDITKVLGMRWNAQKDLLTLQDRNIPITDITTKRMILQCTSRVYDPLGFLTPVTVRAKILLQDLWQQKYNWDDPLPSEIRNRWQNIATDVNTATSCSFPRHYFHTGNDTQTKQEVIIHVFVDASMSSYGATVYICKGNQSALMMSNHVLHH